MSGNGHVNGKKQVILVYRHTFYPKPLIATIITKGTISVMLPITHDLKKDCWKRLRSRSGHKSHNAQNICESHTTYVSWIIVRLKYDIDAHFTTFHVNFM